MGSVQQELYDASLPVYIHTLSPGMVLTGASQSLKFVLEHLDRMFVSSVLPIMPLPCSLSALVHILTAADLLLARCGEEVLSALCSGVVESIPPTRAS